MFLTATLRLSTRRGVLLSESVESLLPRVLSMLALWNAVVRVVAPLHVALLPPNSMSKLLQIYFLMQNSLRNIHTSFALDNGLLRRTNILTYTMHDAVDNQSLSILKPRPMLDHASPFPCGFQWTQSTEQCA